MRGYIVHVFKTSSPIEYDNEFLGKLISGFSDIPKNRAYQVDSISSTYAISRDGVYTANLIGVKVDYDENGVYEPSHDVLFVHSAVNADEDKDTVGIAFMNELIMSTLGNNDPTWRESVLKAIKARDLAAIASLIGIFKNQNETLYRVYGKGVDFDELIKATLKAKTTETIH